MPARLPNSELAFYENMLALLLESSQVCKRLMYHAMDDPETLRQVNDILIPLAKMKKQVIQRRDERKDEK